MIAGVAALVAVTAARVALINALPDQGYFAKYLVFADRILAGHIPTDRLGDLSPGYLWLLVALRALGAGVRAIRALQITALSGIALLCALAARRVGGWVAGVGAAIFVLTNRAALVTATELEPETLIALLVAAAIAAIVMGKQAWIAGLFVGAAVVCRPVAGLTLVLIAAWMFFFRSRREAMALIGSAVIPIVVVLAANDALTCRMAIMDPGTVFYDGNNPLAAGCAGVLPRIVADLDAASMEPDFLHVAYRLVAARASGGSVPSNRYWSAKAIAWMSACPRAASRLFAWKAVLALHNYDVYDLATTKRKADSLPAWLFIPFGILVALAIVGVVRRGALPVALFALASFAALIVFYVSSRQREAMLPPLAVLAGAGVSEIVARRGSRRLIAGGSAAIIAMLLAQPIGRAREDAYGWWATFQSSRSPAVASILRTADPPLIAPDALRAEALRAAQSPAEETRFDAAVALQKAGAWRESDAVLNTLDGYEPHRENRAVSSVAFYRARAALHLGSDPRPLLARAEAEAAGDPNVLALEAALGDAAAARRLDALHDPFTRDYALALAYLDRGDRARALALRDAMLRKMPEWQRPRTLP